MYHGGNKKKQSNSNNHSNETQNSNQHDIGYQTQVLPVTLADDEEIDLAKPATTAMEYLRQVRYEANQLPDVTYAEGFSTSDMAQALQDSLEQNDESPAEEQTVDPDQENRVLAFKQWQQDQVTQFSQHRQVMKRWKARGIPEQSKGEIPAATDKQAWFQLSIGDRGQMPSASVVLGLNQSQLRLLLDHHLEWMTSSSSYSDLQGCWLYALVTQLDRPLDADTTACLRDICRECSARVIQDELAKQQHVPSAVAGDTAGLHLFITIVSHYFGQHDLKL